MMKIEFRDTQLLDLYEGKPTTDKQFKSNPALVKQYVKTVNKLRAVDRIEDLFRLNSLNYKKTVGDRKGQSSVDINDQYRLHFEEIADPDSNQVVLLAIEELSNHYA